MPTSFIGQCVANLDRVSAFTETYFAYEDMLPQGANITLSNNTQKVIDHFLEPQAKHWASSAAGNPEVQFYRLLQDGKINTPVLHGMSIFNTSGNGYWDYGNGIFPSNAKDGFVVPVVPLIAEGQVLMSLFEGATTYLFNNPGSALSASSNSVSRLVLGRANLPGLALAPLAKSVQADLNNKDYIALHYMMKASARFWRETTAIEGSNYSIKDLMDGTQEYLRWNTEVSYDGGVSFTKLKAPEWQMGKKTAVRAIVNRNKNLIAIYAVQPYGVEQSSVIVRYNANGYNWQKTINVPVGVNVLCIAKLTSTTSLNISPNNANIASVGGSQVVNVSSSANWTVSSNVNWLIPSTVSGTGNNFFSINIANNTGASRVGTITVTADGIAKTIAITQADISEVNNKCGGSYTLSNISGLSASVTYNAASIIANGLLSPSITKFNVSAFIELKPGFCTTVNSITSMTIAPCISSARLGVEEEPKESPLTVLEVFPNPTDGVIRINYQIKASEIGKISIVLTNEMGQSTVNIAQIEAQTEGNYSLTFDTQKLPMGVYLLTLQTQQRRQVKRLVVVK